MFVVLVDVFVFDILKPFKSSSDITGKSFMTAKNGYFKDLNDTCNECYLSKLAICHWEFAKPTTKDGHVQHTS